MLGNKTRENAVEALNQAKKIQQDLSAMQEQITRLRLINQSMWEILKQKLDLKDEDLQALYRNKEQEAEQQAKVAEACPSCGRALQEHSKACIYCGTLVPTRRLF